MTNQFVLQLQKLKEITICLIEKYLELSIIFQLRKSWISQISGLLHIQNFSDKKIDELLQDDLCIVADENGEENYLPSRAFLELIEVFPNSYEVKNMYLLEYHICFRPMSRAYGKTKSRMKDT